MSKLYCCYSVPLKNYLLKNGLSYEIVALNARSHKTFWVFFKNPKLDNLLKEWSNSIVQNS